MQKKIYKGREEIIEGFKNGIFPLNYDEREEQESRDKEEQNKIRNENGLIDYKRLNRLINLKKRDINDEFIKKHFLVQDLGALLEKLKKIKNNAKRNKMQVGLTNRGLRDLKEEIEDMINEEKETENPKEIVYFLEMILEFNKQ